MKIKRIWKITAAVLFTIVFLVPALVFDVLDIISGKFKNLQDAMQHWVHSRD